MKPLSRRTFLQGVGVTISLPFLEAMLPSRAYAASETPKFIFIYRGNGESKESWIQSAGHDSVIKPFFDAIPGQFRGLSGVSIPSAKRYRMGDHSSRAVCMLTGARGLPSSVTEWVTTVQAARTLDFLIADRFGSKPLVIGPVDWRQETSRPNTAYYSNLSWEGPKPATRLKSPIEVFNKLTGSNAPAPSPSPSSGSANASKIAHNSVLDFAMNAIADLKPKLGSADKAKMDEYLTALRTQEIKIQQTATETTQVLAECKTPANGYGPMPSVKAADFAKLWHASTDQFLELIRLAMACEMTNVASFMIDTESSGVIDDHHSWSHATDTAGKNKFDDLNRAYSAQVANFVKNMAKTPGADGKSLLYNSTVIYGSGLGESHNHEYSGLKLVVGGNGGGKLSPTGAIDSTVMNLDSLMLTVGNNFGLNLPSWGWETGSSGGNGAPVTSVVRV